MRSRTLKASYFTSEQVASLEPLTRQLFQGLWCLADREGRLENRPLTIKARVLPFDNCDVATMLLEIERAGLIALYEVDRRKLIQVVKFTTHQNVHPKEQPSELPALEEPKSRGKVRLSSVPATASNGITEASNASPSLPSLPSSSIPSSRRRGVRAVTPGRKIDLPFDDEGRPIGGERNERVFVFWKHHLRHPDALLDEERDKVIDGAFGLGYTEEQLFTAIIGCASSPYHQGANKDNKVYDKLSLILRDAEHIDDFIKRAQPAPLTRDGYRR